MQSMDYQYFARKTVNRQAAEDPNYALLNGALGLSGETGEVADQIKKHYFQGHDLDKTKIKDELGDVLWYISLLCDAIDVTLGEVMDYNIQKLRKRYPHGFDEEKSINREE